MPDAADRIHELASQMEKDYAEGWRPEPGDMLVGKVTELERGNTEYGPYPIVVIHDEIQNKDIAIHCFHFVINKEMNELRPAIGERIAVKYIGEKPTKDGKRTIHAYKVSVEGRSKNIWDTPTVPATTPVPAIDTSEVDTDDDLPF